MHAPTHSYQVQLPNGRTIEVSAPTQPISHDRTVEVTGGQHGTVARLNGAVVAGSVRLDGARPDGEGKRERVHTDVDPLAVGRPGFGAAYSADKPPFSNMAKGDQTQAMKLINIANELFEFRVDQVRRDVIGVPKAGSGVALRLKGREAVSGRLLREYLRRYQSVPSKAAQTGVLEVLDATGAESDPVKTYLRCARIDDDAVVVDLGRMDGRCVLIAKGSWNVIPKPPAGVYFRRTTVTAAMAPPKLGGNLDRLRSLFKLDKETWDLVLAWLHLAWLEDIPIPILGLLGPYGAGKSYLAKLLVQLVDPAPAPLRRLPSKRADWPIVINGSRVLGLDNVSRLSLDVSDDICGAVTGSGNQTRQLYTDDDQIIFNYRRGFVLTSIDPGAMQGDLADRLMIANLPQMSELTRRTERDMDARIRTLLPRLSGALFDSVARVLANPVELERMPRMADAAQIMAALDAQQRGSDVLQTYKKSQASAVSRVLESDPVAETLLRFMRQKARWAGTPTELYNEIARTTTLPDHNWPANAQKLSERLTRLTPALRQAKGLVVARSRADERRLILSWRHRRNRRRKGVNPY
jgi:hypothetical protein